MTRNKLKRISQEARKRKMKDVERLVDLYTLYSQIYVVTACIHVWSEVWELSPVLVLLIKCPRRNYYCHFRWSRVFRGGIWVYLIYINSTLPNIESPPFLIFICPQMVHRETSLGGAPNLPQFFLMPIFLLFAVSAAGNSGNHLISLVNPSPPPCSVAEWVNSTSS